MGINSSSTKTPGLLDCLFSSTKQRVLGILYGQPHRSFYSNELIKLAAIGTGAVQRELATLTSSGLVTVLAVGNQRHYRANAQSPIFEELRSIIQKTVGLAGPLQDALEPVLDDILAAFVYGSVAKKTDTADSDIDLMVVSDHLSYGDLFTALEEASVALGRPINPTILSHKEFQERMARQESFLTRVIQQPKIWIVGKDGDFGT